MERYTVTIVPSSGRRMRSFSLSSGRFLLALVSVVVVVTMSLAFGSLATWRFFKRQKQTTVDAVHKYEALNKELRDIRKSYWDFKSVLGIEPTDDSDEPGRGGPEMPELTDSADGNLSIEDISEDVAMELHPVLTEAALLKSDFEDLVVIAQSRYDELGFIPSIWPVKTESGTHPWLTSRFGRRKSPFTGAWEMHEGIDIAAPRGTPLIATADGIIEKVAKDRYLGNHVQIRHNERFSTRYGHMDRFVDGMKEGDEVRRGDVIGYMGRTGRTTGCHVHYEICIDRKRVNPADYILN